MNIGDDSMRKIYTSVDLGSDYIKVVVLELHHNKLNLLAASSVKSSGIKKGLITNATAALSSLQTAIEEVEGILHTKIKRVLTSIPAHNAEYIYAQGTIKIEREDKKINSEDINEIFRKVIKDRVRFDYELITIHPIDFTVDDRTELKNPKGLTGDELSGRVIIVATPKKNIYSVVSLIEAANLEVVDVSINSIGDSYTLRNEKTATEVGAIVNLGAETTTVAIFNKGIITNASVIPLGSRKIDSDIAYIFKLSLHNANKLKEKFSTAHRRYASAENIREIENVDKEEIKINQYELSEVVMFRAEEILNLVKKELKALTNKKMQYIILTGGGSHLANITELATNVLEEKVLLGDVKVVGARNNRFSSAVGNIVYFINKLNLKGKQYSMFSSSD